MAISREDNHDVKKALGTAIARKVASATRDGRHGGSRHMSVVSRSINKTGSYASPAAKKAIAASEQKGNEQAIERTERYKREGLI